MALVPILIFTLVGLGAALAAKVFAPRLVPSRMLPLALLGVMGSVAGGLMSLVLFGHGRAHDLIYDHAHAGGSHFGGTLPDHWVSLLCAPAGALLALALYRLVRSRMAAR